MESPVIYFKDQFSKRLKSDLTHHHIVSPFSTIVRKEIGDLVRSWRFIVLLALIVLTFFGSIYVSMTNLKTAVTGPMEEGRLLLYLKILTTTDGSLPSFHIFMSFLGAILGIGLGFDAVNAEQQNGTLIRLLAQPVYRDNLLLAKFISPVIVITTLFLSLSLLMIGGGLIITGVSIEWVEVLRILSFVLLTVLYVGFWLSLSILLSVKFKQATTSALTAIGIWLFFTIFYKIVVNMVVKAFLPDPAFLSQGEVLYYNNVILNLLRFSPSQLYTDATTVLLLPAVRSLGPLTMEQMAGAIPTPLSFRESLLVAWPQITGLLAATVLCFALSYYLFMRREIRG
ncbi:MULTISPECIES: ABC transporter permease [Niastella]|uniref:ABC transporter permease n=1 Tax=Niastella soli TaxID=2821487 RepID=A0ABS3YLY6_9BACT|nr:ABC transporter permease subunit [Niastella soli]MBO9198890.1 ABC transporter permease [Niastella soli]